MESHHMCEYMCEYVYTWGRLYVCNRHWKKESNIISSIIIGHIFTWIMKSSFFFAISINKTTSINLLFVFFLFCIWNQNTNCILAHGLFLSYYDVWINSCTFSVIKYRKRQQSIEKKTTSEVQKMQIIQK